MTRFRTVLCPVDFSEYSRRALLCAERLCLRHAARLIVLHVLPPVQPASYGFLVTGSLEQDLEVDLRVQEGQLLEEFVAKHLSGQVPAEQVLIPGSPALGILDCASEKNADLIVLGTHGRSGVERFLLGSVTEKIIRRAGCPVLVVRRSDRDPEYLSGEDPMIGKTLLVPVDLSDHSELTLRYAAELAREGKGKLLLLHVVDRSAGPLIDPGYSSVLADYWTEVESEARKILVDLAQKVSGGEWEIEPIAVSGRIAEEILRVSEERKVHLIVMGARDSWLSHLVAIGTTAHRVLSHAGCPVLLLRGKP